MSPRESTKVHVWTLSAREVVEAVIEELLCMGLEPDAVQRFVSNPALSPRHRLTNTAHLDFLGKLLGRGLLVAAVAGARSEAEAMSLQELTRMYARYHESVAPFKAFRDYAVGQRPPELRVR